MSFVGVHIPLIAVVLYLLLTVTVPIAEIAPVLVVLLVATVLGTVATSAAIYGLLAPVRSASSAIRGYLSGKKLSALPTHHPDQAGVLMADVQEAITRLDRALDAAYAAAERAEGEKEAKFALLSRMSHELRTPLNHILGFSELIQNEMLGPLGQKAYANYAGDIRESGSALLDLVQAVLEVSEVEAGTYQTTPKSVEPGPVVEECVALAHLAAQNANVAIEAGSLRAAPAVQADPRAFKQVLSHYLLAVIRKAGSGGGITVATEVQDDGLTLVIADDCGALLDDDMRYLRSKTRALRPPAANQDGIESASAFSLTLMLVDGLMRVQDGGFEIRPTSDTGKEARFHLPLAPALQRAA